MKKARYRPRKSGLRRIVRTVDSHTEGNPTRVIVEGAPAPPGDSLLARQQWLAGHDDALRKLLCFEPRGGGLMCAVLLMPSVDADSDFSVIIMEQDAYVPMSGHCIIGAATTVVETGLVPMQSPVTVVRFDTLAGQVTCYVDCDGDAARSVTFDNVDSFLHQGGAPIEVEGFGRLAVDIAYGGDYYAIVDADKLNLELRPDREAEMIAASVAIREAVAEQLHVAHPEEPRINQCYQVQFVSGRTGTGDYKQTILSPPGAVDRSPCGTGTSARLACLYSRGEIGLGQPKRFEGVLGTCFTGQVTRAETRNGITYVTPRVTGSAFITGHHQFVLYEGDPFPTGFRLGPRAGRKAQVAFVRSAAHQPLGLVPPSYGTLFNRKAGSFFKRWLTGSTSMPADSNAVTPSNGSASSSSMMRRPGGKVAHELYPAAREVPS